MAYLDMMSFRFAAFQDVVGKHIFSLTLISLGEELGSFIDKLNRLEKLSWIDSASWWMKLREIRNDVAHEYPEALELKIRKIEQIFENSHELLVFWEDFKKKLQQSGIL